MATQYDPIAKDGSLNTTEATPRNIADVLAEGLKGIEDALPPTYTEGDGINISNNEISVDTTFTEASTRANIASGDSLATIWGKIKKFFTDLKTVAFTGAYSDLSGTEKVAVKNANNSFSQSQTVDLQNGTTSTVGLSYLLAGNNKAEGTDKNSKGRLGLYSDTANLAVLQATGMTATRIIDIPDASGTLALYDDDILARVTADGVKTYSQLLNELFAALDVTKMSSKSFLYSNSLGIMPVCDKSPSGCSFGSVVPVNNGAADTRAVRIMASDSFYISTRTMTSGTSLTDRSNIVPSSGDVFVVCK